MFQEALKIHRLAVDHIGLQQFRKWGQSNSSLQMEPPYVHQCLRTLIPGHEGSGGKFLLITMKRICSGLIHVENVILTSREVHDTRSSILRVSLQLTELAGINENAADDNRG